MTAIVYRGKGATTWQGPGTFNVAKPAGVVQNDVMVMVIASVNNGQETLNVSGWTLLDRRNSVNFIQNIYYKVAGSSEPANYSVTMSGGNSWTGTIHAWGNVGLVGGPIVASGGAYYSPSASSTICPSILTDVPAYIVGVVGLRSSTSSFSPPAGTEEKYEFVNDPSHCVISFDAPVPGNTGDKTVTHGASSDRVGQTFALREPNTAPNTPTALQRTGSQTDTTPNFSAAISDPDTSQQIKARFEIYQNDETTLIATVDSTLQAGSHTATAEYGSALSVGTYKVKAKTIDDLGLESGYTAFVTFKVTSTVEKDLILLWNIKEAAIKDLVLLWDIQQNGTKDLILLWHTRENVDPVDLILKWNSHTPWTEEVEGSTEWTEVYHG